jgi:predicted TIM-barrel fold metal-dependent hydrolase
MASGCGRTTDDHRRASVMMATGMDDAGRELPWVISADDHVVEPPDLWERWLPSKCRAHGPRVEPGPTTEVPTAGGDVYVRGGDGPIADWWVFEDVVRGTPLVMACAGYPEEEYSMRPMRFADMRTGCYDPAARVADMDQGHIERSLNFPNYPRFAGQLFSEAKDKDLALACVEAWNNWMIEEWCGDSGGRLIPLCIVPLWDPHLAAAEVHRNAARGQKAITFTELPANLGLPSIHDKDRHWDPLFQACDETGTVICMHIGSGSKLQRTSSDAPVGVTTALTSLNAYMAMADWLLSGTLLRFPNLKIAFSESQVGWMPFLLDRLDRVFTNSGAWSDLDPVLTELPSSQVPGRVFGCFFDDMVGVDARHQIGIEQLVFETDYPHQDSTWPHTPELVAEIGARVTPEELEMLVRSNAITMLDLEPGDLRPVHLRTKVATNGEAAR